MDLSKLVRTNYDFRWEVLDVIIGGKSLIDANMGLTGFPMKSIEDADRFMKSYGFDLDDPIQSAEILGNFRESISFIRKFFLQPENPDGLSLEIPRKILEIQKIQDLLLMASVDNIESELDEEKVLLRDWACAVLKVVHTLAHIDKDITYSYLPDIQKQVFDRFYKVVHREDNDSLYLGDSKDDPNKVVLVSFETKSKKARESILLKLLHKTENVAEDIYDLFGIRFVTKTRLDALRVVKYLKDSMIVVPANIKPSRSRNTLVELSRLRNELPSILEKVDQGEMAYGDVVESLDRVTRDSIETSDNPHSSEFYRSIQFTCRQLIKIKNPIFDDLKELKSLAKKHSLDVDFSKILDRVDLKYIQRELRFFYPYEVQVIDQSSAEENEAGQSAHSEYKKAQVQTALKRVMGNLMNVA